MYCANGILFFAISATCFKSAVMVGTHRQTVLLGNSLQLVCAYNGGDSIQSYRWSKQLTISPFFTILTNCSEIYNKNPCLYSAQCLDTVNVLTFSKITAEDHELTIICRVHLMNGTNQDVNKTQIYVQVPVQSVYLTAQDGYFQENIPVRMECNTSYARPTPNVRWFLDPGTERKEDDKEIRLELSNTTYENEKLFSLKSTLTTSFNRTVNGWQIYCETSNVPGQSSESKKLLLNITYEPSADGDFKSDIRSKLNVPVTLQFRALANPMPSFTWKMKTGSPWKNVTKSTLKTDPSWQNVTNSTTFSILTVGLRTDLTVNNFTLNVENNFRVIVKNFVGSLLQEYTIFPYDRPDKPSDFSHIEKYLTDTTVLLSWRPGFNGGLPQNFTIKYRRKIDEEWTTLVIPDTGQDLMNFTIRGLNIKTVYVFAIYASNSKNSSDISEIAVMTKAAIVEETTKSAWPVSIVIGCIVSLMVIAATTALIIFGWRRYKLKKRGKITTNHVSTYRNMAEMQTVSVEVLKTKSTIYEELKDSGIQEKTEMAYETLRHKRDIVSSSNPVYMNLNYEAPGVI